MEEGLKVCAFYALSEERTELGQEDSSLLSNGRNYLFLFSRLKQRKTTGGGGERKEKDPEPCDRNLIKSVLELDFPVFLFV